jgi:hypothetical protein
VVVPSWWWYSYLEGEIPKYFEIAFCKSLADLSMGEQAGDGACFVVPQCIDFVAVGN